MNTISVPIYIESRYRVNRKKIKETVIRVLSEKGMTSPVEVSVAIVGDRKMRSLNKKYRGLDKTTNVLSFSQTEGEGFAHSSELLVLGDIVISYPVIIDEAALENMLVDDKICFWVEHGLEHLLGEHHE